MNPDQVILDYLNENLYITTKDAQELGVGRHTLSNMERRGQLVRVKQGIYMKGEQDLDRVYFIQKGCNKIIFSYTTALYFLGLIKEEPEEIHLTVPQGYNTGHLTKRYENIVFHYVKEELFDLYQISVTTNLGNAIRVYDKERSICETIQNRKNLDEDLYLEAISNYFTGEVNLEKLLAYSREFKVENEVTRYIKIILKMLGGHDG